MSDKSHDEPSVLGAGCYRAALPTTVEAEAIWRTAYVDRMVEHGIDPQDARACCGAGEIDLAIDPQEAADNELQYWDSDE